MGLNKIQLIGRLGKDPDYKQTTSGADVVTFSLATSERVKKGTEWADHTEWHNITAFGTTAKNAAKYLNKGSQVYVEGAIRTEKWQDKEGKDRYTTKVIANVIQYLDSKQQQKNVLDELPSADELKSAADNVSFDSDDIPF